MNTPRFFPAGAGCAITTTGRYQSVLAAVIFLLVSTAGPTNAQLSGITYTLSPVGSYVQFDEHSLLHDGYLYGGELGLGFGRTLELSAIYLTGSGNRTNYSGFPAGNSDFFAGLDLLSNRDVEISRLGGRLRLNLSRGSLIPFLTVGTGIVTFRPDDLAESENIYGEGGVGVRFSVANRYTFSVSAEAIGYRNNPAVSFLSEEDLVEAQLLATDFNQESIVNTSLTASLKFYLGGRKDTDLTEVDRALMRQFRGGQFRLAVEPFYGQIHFNKALDFPSEQRVVGLNVGIDLGAYLGLRGFYWSAVEEGDLTSFQGMKFYGGELDLRFQSDYGASLTPYLIVGGGYADLDTSQYEEDTGFAPQSRYFAVAGGGVEIPLSGSMKLQGGLRSLFMSTEEVGDISAPSSVFGSLLYSAGVTFNLGGSGRTAGSVIGQGFDREGMTARDRDEALAVQIEMLQTRLDSIESVEGRQGANYAAGMTTGTFAGLDSLDTAQNITISDGPVRFETPDTVFVETKPVSNLSGQTMTIPVPEVGEIYIRFGNPAPASPGVEYAPPIILGMGQQLPMYNDGRGAYADSAYFGQLSGEQIRQIVRQTMSEQAATVGLTSEQFEASLRNMEDRIERRIQQETDRIRRDLGEDPVTVQVVQNDRPPAADSAAVSPRGDYRVTLDAVWPMLGIHVGDNPSQVLIGLRGDYRVEGRGYRILPEIALALGDRFGLHAVGNMAWGFSNASSVKPYAGFGVGFFSLDGLSGLNLALNLLVGIEYQTIGASRFFGEFSTLDFFDYNKLFIGYRLKL